MSLAARVVLPPPTADLDRLGDELATLAAHLDAATARFLALLREFDARGGWGNGFRSCAEWLSWRVGLAPGAARKHVRVARALEHLPRLAEALARGEVSYSKVRALTRVATPETEARLLAVARAGTAAHVERIVRGWRRVDAQGEVPDGAARHRRRWLQVYRTTTACWSCGGGSSPKSGRCWCGRWRPRVRRCMRGSGRREDAGRGGAAGRGDPAGRGAAADPDGADGHGGAGE
jgi:Domain of unknown function (DUF222)